jgi:hypothetical protein
MKKVRQLLAHTRERDRPQELLMRRTIILRTLVLLAASGTLVLGLLGPAAASAAHAAPHPVRPGILFPGYEEFCDEQGPCLKDPSDGGVGTQVIMADPGGDKSEDWIFVSSSLCGGTVKSGCGLPDFLVDRYGPNNGNPGDAIAYLKQEVSGKCLKLSLDSGWDGQMGTCDDVSTDFILSPTSGSFYYVPSVNASEYFNTVYWLCGAFENDQPSASNTCDANKVIWDS